MNAKPVERAGPYLVLDQKDAAPKSAAISVRIREDLRDAMIRAMENGPYRIAMTALVERGIVLAIRELEELNKRLK